MQKFLAAFWFPLAMVILAFPGVALFALNLLHRQEAVNHWLLENFQLGYHLPLPGWGMAILLFAPPAIVLLYFLKLKRAPVRVPSTFLWRRSIEDLRGHSLFQWLRKNVLLLLQVLTALALIYGVMAFHRHGPTESGGRYIIMIDSSASMSATDLPPNRLAWAKQEALKEIGAAPDAALGMVMELNDQLKIRQEYTDNRELLRQAVTDIQLTHRPTRFEEALLLADSLANPHPDREKTAAPEDAAAERSDLNPERMRTTVHLFSDGRFPDLSDAAQANLRRAGREAPLGNLDFHYHAAGAWEAAPSRGAVRQPAWASSDNVGLVTFNASRDEEDPARLRVLVGAVNDRAEEVETAVDLFENGKFLDRKTLRLPPRRRSAETGDVRTRPGEAAAVFECGSGQAILHARLVNVKDHFPLDDEAWLAVGSERKARVLAAAADNRVLRAFFNDPAQRLEAEIEWISRNELPPAPPSGRTAAGQERLQGARAGAYDLVIFDRCGPILEKDMPRGNTFFIGRMPPGLFPSEKQQTPSSGPALEKRESFRIEGWNGKHPLLRHLSGLQHIGSSEALTVRDLPYRARLIETDRDGAVLFTRQRGLFTDLVLTFPLLKETSAGEVAWTSNWPLHSSFPIFLKNVLNHLGNAGGQVSEGKSGQSKTLRSATAVRRGVVIDPEGKETELTPGPSGTDFSFGPPERVGSYRVHWEDGTEQWFAVNLLDLEESNIEPRREFNLGPERIVSGQERSRPRELWKWFTLLALIVLLAEWYIYSRRAC